jgi:hypothetical protein
VLYVHAANVPSRFAQFADSLQTWTAETDVILQESAAAAGGSRRFRFVTDDACNPVVEAVTLSPAGDGNFDTTIDELLEAGFDRTDRYYLLFMDTRSAGICGIATGWDDDDPGQANWNNYGPGYARVDAGCWDAPTAAHELMHNLGAVQDSAPNSTLAGHCIDAYDVMCYDDGGPRAPNLHVACADEDLEERYDCGYNDYFHPNPSPNSYLATHWNSASNRFLVGGGAGGDEDGAPPAVSWLAPVGNGGTHAAASGAVSLEVAASDGSGINRVEFWRYDAVADNWIRFATDRAAPYEATIDIAALNAGANQIDADAIDGALNQATAHIWIERTSAGPNGGAPRVAIVSPGSGARLKAKKRVPIAVEIANTTGASPVEVRVCAGGSCAWDAASSLGTDGSAPFAVGWNAPKKGTFTFLASVSDSGGSVVSDPVTVKIKNIKSKKKKRR